MHVIFTQEQRDLFIREKEKIKGFSTTVDFMPVPINNGLYAFPTDALLSGDFALLKKYFERNYPDLLTNIRKLTTEDKLEIE